MTGHWAYFLFLTKQAAGAYRLAGFMGIVVCFALFKNYKIDKADFQASHLLMLLPFLHPLLLLIWGTAFEHTTAPGLSVPGWQLHGLWFIVLCQVAMSVYFFLRFKGLRLSVAAISVLQGFLTMLAFFLAWMSVSGTWI